MIENDLITSVQNARIKHVAALQQKSSLRREEGLFIVEGRRELQHCMSCGYQIESLFAIEGLELDVDMPVTRVSAAVYEKMAYRGSTEGVVAVVRSRKHDLDSLHLPEDAFVVVLESVEKPGNLGAILRSADAAGVDAVIVCDPLTDLYNPNVVRASIGGVFSVPTAVCSSADCITFLKERHIQILTAQLQDSAPYYDCDMCRATAIVMGTESTGLTDFWRSFADAHIRIPMLGRLDSLNVSVSAAILMYEGVRQRKSKEKGGISQ